VKKEINYSAKYRKGIFGMKIKNKELVKRIIATALSLIMVVGLLPFSAFAAESDANVATDTSSFLNIDTPPAQLNTAGHPYGDDGYFNLAPQNELMKIYTGGDRSTGSTKNDAWITQNLDLGKDRIDDWSNAGDTIDTYHRENPVHEWSYLQAVAFDPEGVGRDTHIAYVGYDPSAKAIKLGVYDVARGVASSNTRWVADAEWIAKADGYSLMQFNAYNFMSITAGDYDGDGEETIVVFASGDGTSASLSEWYFSPYGRSNWIYQQATGNSLLHKYYIKDKKGDTTDAGLKMGADLATGDFDGDHIDDLAVVSYRGIEGVYEDHDQVEEIAPYLAVALGKGSGDHIVNQTSGNLSAAGGNDNGLATFNFDENKIHFPVSPTITAGNMDDDNADELIVAGYRVTLTNGILHSSLENAFATIDGVRITAFNVSGNSIKRGHYSSIDVNDWTKNVADELNQHYYEKVCATEIAGDKNIYFAPPQVAVEFVRTNGAGAPEDLFLNGSFMKYSQQKNAWEEQYRDGHFSYAPESAGGWKAQLGFITNVSVGVFDDNELGREQVAYTVWFKDNASDNLIGTSDNADDYSVMAAISGGMTYNDSGTSYGAVESYGTSGLNDEYNGYADNDTQEFHNEEFDYDSRKNLLFVAVDIDRDGVLAKYHAKDYTYSDPTVLTVLQAAPYYDAFGYLDKCETSYTFETTFVVGQGTSKSTSFSVGASVEAETPVVKSSISSGYSGGWEESFTKEFSETYSTTFTATKDNVVVLQRTPVIVYMYLVQKASDGSFGYTNDDGNDSGNYITISVPCEPVYALMTVEEYNAFVESTLYLQTTEREPSMRLQSITMDALIDNAGNPTDYFNEWPAGATNLSTSTYNASTGTGSITSAYTTSDGTTIEQSTTQGFYFDSSVQAGASAFGFGVWGGVEYSTEGSTTQSSFTTNVSSTTVSGTVGNLGESDLPADMLSGYTFDWQFGSWPMDLGKNAKINAYGYRVMGGREVAQVTGLKVTDGTGETESAVLTWDAVDGASSYTVYTYEDGEYTFLASTSDPTYEYPIPTDSRQHSYSFSVTYTKDGTGSVYSNRVTYYRQSYGMSAYQVAVQNGFEGTIEEWLESLVGADGKDGVGVESFSYNKDGELLAHLTDGTIINLGVIHGEDGANGLTPYIDENGNWWIGEVDTGVKATGEDGADGITPQLRINTETNEWEVSLDNGVTWETTGVVATGAKGDTGTGIASVTLDEANSDETKSVYIITLTDNTTYSFTVTHGVDGADGATGDPGADGITPQLRINTETNEWEVSLDNGTTWTSTGVVATGAKGDKGDKGDTGTGIASVTLDEANSDETKSVYIITLTDNTTYSFTVNHGADGADGATGDPGADGITPQLRINTDTNEWEVSLDNGVTWSSTGVKATGEKGDKGDKGDAGVGIKSATLDQDGNLIITLTDDTVQNLGKIIGTDGADGTDGTDGKDGVGVKSAALDENGNLIITLTNDTVFNLGAILGTDGKDGVDGKDGINGKDGKDGTNGKDGADGKDGANGKDGLGVADIKIDENGNFIFTMSDGSTINAGSVPKDDSVQVMAGVNEGGITQEDINTVKTLATVATILSSISLLWNLVSLFALIGKKKKVMIP